MSGCATSTVRRQCSVPVGLRLGGVRRRVVLQLTVVAAVVASATAAAAGAGSAGAGADDGWDWEEASWRSANARASAKQLATTRHSLGPRALRPDPAYARNRFLAYYWDYGDTNNNIISLIAALGLARRLKRVLLLPPSFKNSGVFDALDEAALHELDGYVEWERRSYLADNVHLWGPGEKVMAIEDRKNGEKLSTPKTAYGLADTDRVVVRTFTWPKSISEWEALAAMSATVMYFGEILHAGVFFQHLWKSVIVPHVRPAKAHIDFARAFVREKVRGLPYVAVHVRTQRVFVNQLPDAADLAGQVGEAMRAATARVRRRVLRKDPNADVSAVRVDTLLVISDMLEKHVVTALTARLLGDRDKYGVNTLLTSSDVGAMGPPKPGVVSDECLAAMAEHFIYNPDSTVSGIARLFRVRLLGKSPGSATVMRKNGKPVKQVTELFLPVDCQRTKPRPCMPYLYDPKHGAEGLRRGRRLRGPGDALDEAAAELHDRELW